MLPTTSVRCALYFNKNFFSHESPLMIYTNATNDFRVTRQPNYPLGACDASRLKNCQLSARRLRRFMLEELSINESGKPLSFVLFPVENNLRVQWVFVGFAIPVGVFDVVGGIGFVEGLGLLWVHFLDELGRHATP